MFSLTQISRKLFGVASNNSKPRSVSLKVEELETRLVPTTLLPGALKNVGQVLLPLPGTPAWFQTNMNDPGVRSLAQTDFINHHSINRTDMLNILSEVQTQGPLTAAELHDLRFMVSNAAVLHMTDEVRFETSHLVNDTFTQYQGADAGYLDVGSSVAFQQELVGKWFMGMDHPIADTGYSNVTGNLYVGGAPSYLNVHQGALGDCWMLASLAEVAAREPSVIKNMFTYDGQTTEVVVNPINHIPFAQTVDVWTVRFSFANGNYSYVTVDSMLPSGGKHYDQPTVTNALGNGALWVALAEKAYVQANGNGFVTSASMYENAYVALNGGNPLWALSAIAGQTAPIAINPGNVAAAWNAGNLIVMCTGDNTASYDIVPNHAYAVVADSANAAKPFTVYNPWGTDAAGWAPYQYNGFYVYGRFSANQAFLTANFVLTDHTNAPVNVSVQADVPMTTATPTTIAKDAAPHATSLADNLRDAYDAAIAEWMSVETMKLDLHANLA